MNNKQHHRGGEKKKWGGCGPPDNRFWAKPETASAGTKRHLRSDKKGA